MSDVNIATISGELLKTPEIKMTKSGYHVVNFTLKCARPSKAGKSWTDYISCQAWGGLADIVGSLSGGDKIMVSGQIQTRSYDKDGHKVYVTEVFAREAMPITSTIGRIEEQEDTAQKPAVQEQPSEDIDDLLF